MIRTVIHIDEQMHRLWPVRERVPRRRDRVGGKAKLLRDDFCDGMGDCLPSCPTGAITFVEREALPYDEPAVVAAQGGSSRRACGTGRFGDAAGLPGSRAKRFRTPEKDRHPPKPRRKSQLAQWPCQIKLMPLQSPCTRG